MIQIQDVRITGLDHNFAFCLRLKRIIKRCNNYIPLVREVFFYETVSRKAPGDMVGVLENLENSRWEQF